jgi:hypothetical protein
MIGGRYALLTMGSERLDVVATTPELGGSLTAPALLGAALTAAKAALSVRGAGSSLYDAPWTKGVKDVVEGATFVQCADGSCVSATGQNLTGGALTEAQLLEQIGEWSNSQLLAKALNQAVPGAGWQGGYFASGEDALKVASQGTMGAEIKAFGYPGHMVTLVPLDTNSGTFKVFDTAQGVSYVVDSSWVEKYVIGGTFK